MATKMDFSGPQLTTAIIATFERRAAALPSVLPAALAEAFWGDAAANCRWSASVSRLGSDVTPSLREAVEVIAGFLGPVLSAAAVGRPFGDTWSRGGPWMAR
jgi:hypothetical protein